ncbi:thiolase family protein [Microbacterium koreense]|uniref:Thiolase family protein n=1 Tax=Microbacterium koreense TaxID=323761 RepID=A0ABW2ZRV0_9MICO
MNSAVIVDAVRTPSGRGKPGGALEQIHPVDLLATTLSALVERTGLDPALIDDVIGGCVSQVGTQSFNITRNAVLAAGFPDHVPGTTIDRQCGSSQQAAAFAAQGVISGGYDIAIACGVEEMSRNPIGSNAAGADPYGEGIASRYPQGLVSQGISAELIASRWGLSRAQLDDFAALSHTRATETARQGGFARELIPVSNGSELIAEDQTIRPATSASGLGALQPSFHSEALAERYPEINWVITPGNSSPLTDGASAVLVMSEERAKMLGLTPRARFHSFAVTGSDPIMMLTGIIPVTKKILAKSGLSLDDMDVLEVNEAFASVPLAWLAETGADPAKLNPRGGAIALGHPLGASGGRLLSTMLNHLEATGGRYGLQTMCEGGGMANATIIERL